MDDLTHGPETYDPRTCLTIQLAMSLALWLALIVAGIAVWRIVHD